MKKILIILVCCVVAVLVLGLGAGAYWWLARPQVIVLKDGTELTLLGVTYGKHHTSPKVKSGGHSVRGNALETANDSVCVWIEQKHKQNNWPNYQVLVYDANHTACAGESTRTYGNFNGQSGVDVVGFAFEAFPRRSGKIYLSIQAWNQRNGQQEKSKTEFSFRNPAPRGAWPRWAPDTLPNTQTDGDLQATLTKCSFDQNTFGGYGQGGKANDPSRNGVYTSFRMEQGGVVVTNWQPVKIDTTDATGNHTSNRGWSNRQENDEEVMVYQYGLWPDEPAWKLRVEMSRQSGFNADETWTVSGVPLQPGDMNDMYNQSRKQKPFGETTMGESKLQVFPVTQLSKEQGRMYGNNMEGVVRIHVNPEPEGMRMTVIKITDDQDRTIKFNNWGWGGGDYRFSLNKLKDAKSINITLAFHKSRFFEYTVKPTAK